MSDEKNKNKDKTKMTNIEFDKFILNSIYPEAEKVFTFQPQSLEELKNDCLIILDTNVLLVPYNVGKESLKQIHKIYESFVKANRLIIPGQVTREFAKNRVEKLKNIHQQFTQKANTSKLQKGTYPILESLNEYQDTLSLEEQIDQLLIKYNDAMKKVLAHIRNWTWNDPVSLLYAELFQKAVFDLNVDKEKVSADLARRQLHNIAPGYKDARKEDNGIGDLLIWLTILEVGKIRQKSVFFISGDEKADWWHKSEGQSLYPRYDLVDEFRRYSDGQSFHIVTFSQFLKIYGASESSVDEVRKEEMKLSREVFRSSYFYEKGLKVYNSVTQFLGLVAQIAYVRNEDLFQFLRDTKESDFLFGDEIVAYLREIYKNGVDLSSVNKRLTGHSIMTQVERERLANKEAELLQWFSNQFDVARQLFGKYLKVTNE